SIVTATTIHAQKNDRRPLLDERIGRIFDSREYDVPRFGPAKWLPDGTAYTTVERDAGGGGAPEIVRYDARTGARASLFSIAREDGRPRFDIDDYSWSRDGRRVLLFTNTRKVWRQNTRGDYWVFDLRSRTLGQLRADEASMMF